MKYGTSITAALVLSLAPSPYGAQAQDNSDDAKANITITSCTVYETKDARNSYNCLAEATKALGGCVKAQGCEIPIGLNLTSGKDIAPGAGFLGKRVMITYNCGAYSMQGGPYEQDEHASLVLDCGGMWW